jgi:hypothetical protein
MYDILYYPLNLVTCLKVMTSGDNLGIFIVNTFKSRKYQRTMPSIVWLMPKPTFWKKDEVLVITQKRSLSRTGRLLKASYTRESE